MDSPPSTFEPTRERSRDLRQAFGRFGTGVTVVTAMSPTGPLAMTANSFTSISLVPPLVLWAPARTSLRHNAFVAAKQFCIHVLGENQLTMARHFATNGGDFSAFAWTPGPFGAPSLAGCLAEFHCSTHAVHPAGDHSLVLGEVRQVIDHNRKDQGLLFENGLFGRFSSLPDKSGNT